MKKSIFITICIFIVLIIYYQADYKRTFIYNKDKTKVFTIWTRLGNNCYIIPGEYYSPFRPNTNFIHAITHKNYIGVVFITGDVFKYKLSIWNTYESIGLDKDIKIYKSNDSLLQEYGILKRNDVITGDRIYDKNKDSLSKVIDYKYIDLNRIYGIKIFDFHND